MKKKSTFQAAIDAWPEDEACGTVRAHREAREDYPEDTPEVQLAELMGSVKHMLKVFSREEDAADLQSRYLAAVRAEITHLEIPATPEAALAWNP